jgi:predicted O-linked N-acetylglucosamine transferase (SPINDLY family)
MTFGALHTFTKVNDRILNLWAGVLASVPRSRLLMLAPQGSVRQRVLKKMAEAGIEAARIEFVGRLPRSKYMEIYRRLDIHLDTLPYCAHATALDSFWMGVPMVTLVGQTLVGRAGWCYLNNLKLTDLAAHTDEQFVNIAASLANDLPRLKELRSTLRHRLEASPLMDGKKFAAAVTTIYREIWQRWCSSAPGHL